MKSYRLLIVLAALLEFSIAARADLAATFTNAAPAAQPAIPRRPSIIFIQCHGLGYGDLSCYGQTNFQTPNLDRLAAEGIRFTRYAGGTDSAETIRGLLFGENFPSAPGEPTLAQRLKQSGYHTGLIGEWTFDREPWRRGFDEFAGFFTDAEAQNYYADHIWRYPHTVYDESNGVAKVFLDHEMLYHNMDGKKGQYLPDLLLTVAANYARINVPDAANRYRPFFLLVNLPAPRPVATGADVFPVPSDAPFTGEAWPPAARNRAALITRLDSGIGRLFEQLKKIGMTNNVAVFFSSSSAPEKFAGTNLNFLLPPDNFRNTNNPVPPRLPMLVHWPKTIPAGQVSDRAWTAADFAPTALEIGYVPPVTNFPGHSILPAMTARPPVKSRAAAPSEPAR